MPVAHRQGADRSGSEDLDENFIVAREQQQITACFHADDDFVSDL